MKLILFSPPQNHPRELELLISFFENGLEVFHLRKPAFSKAELDDYLKNVPEKYLGRIVIHSHYQLAHKYVLKGIHLPEIARKEGVEKISGCTVSTSFHNLKELEMDGDNYSYCFLSPVYDSISKKGYKKAFDHADLKLSLNRLNARIFALGGVTIDNGPELEKLGFNGFAILGAVWENNDPLASFLEIINALKTNHYNTE